MNESKDNAQKSTDDAVVETKIMEEGKEASVKKSTEEVLQDAKRLGQDILSIAGENAKKIDVQSHRQKIIYAAIVLVLIGLVVMWSNNTFASMALKGKADSYLKLKMEILSSSDKEINYFASMEKFMDFYSPNLAGRLTNQQINSMGEAVMALNDMARKKGRIKFEYEIDSVKLNKNGNLGTVTFTMTAVHPDGVRKRQSHTTEWELVDGVWYILTIDRFYLWFTSLHV